MPSPTRSFSHTKSLAVCAFTLALFALILMPGLAGAAQRLVVAELYSSST